ncbi:hypothetical protein, partial [Staphylococcus aureus]|uniref:hypothetical protein n=1 Tax=Staphylococcus aureus TaxID=1280 RepID=UPI001C835E49
KLMLAVAPVVLALTACATTTGTGTGGASAQTTTQQLGVAALKVAVNAKCITKINNVAAWKTATKYMTAEQKFRQNTRCLHSIQRKNDEKLMLAVAPVVLALTACATTTGTGTGGASAQTT